MDRRTAFVRSAFSKMKERQREQHDDGPGDPG
jgi:hypothetical protein